MNNLPAGVSESRIDRLMQEEPEYPWTDEDLNEAYREAQYAATDHPIPHQHAGGERVRQTEKEHSPMTASHTKLNIIPGEPQTLALRTPTGKQVKSRIPGAPDQAYYSLTDGRSLYLPLEVGSMIDQLKLRQGDRVRILKRSSRDWTVEKVGAELQKPAKSSAREMIDGCKENSTPVNGAGEACSDILARCYQSAVEISLGAAEYAKTRGLMIAPSFEDVRCVASVLMISETRGMR